MGGEFEIAVHNMAGRTEEPARIEQRGGRFAELAARKTIANGGAGSAGEKGGLDESLEVDRKVKGVLAEPALGRGDGTEVRSVGFDQFIGHASAIQKVTPSGLNRPHEAASRPGSLQGRRGGQSVEDITHRAEPDNQEARVGHRGQKRISSSVRGREQ